MKEKKNGFKEALGRLFFENTPKPEEEQVTEVTTEEKAKFEESITDENGENITEKAQKIIIESQIEADNDEYPDISKVEEAIETVGSSENHELICNILKNYAKCNPEDLEKDGIKRRQAIEDAINLTKKQAEAIKEEKEKEEQELAQAEKAAEAACTEAINQANVTCEQEIEAEKKRSAEIIAQIRQRADDAAVTAKQQRDATLENLSAQRAENEDVLRKSAALVTETEKQGQVVINKIDVWLGCLKVTPTQTTE